MAADMNLSLILKLVDQVTGPAKAVGGALRKIHQQTEALGTKGQAWADQQLAGIQARKAALRGEAIGVAAMGYSFVRALKPAIEFETAMAGVSKVLDFDSPQGFKEMQADILALTSTGGLPMLAEDIAAIVEAAGQAGVVDSALPDAEERRQLIDFATAAAKMGVAFDISAEQSGEAMAQWRKAMKLTQPEAMALGDAINHLSNNMNAKAPALVDLIRRQGAVAMTAGLAETEVAALGAAMLSGGAGPEVAATGMKNFLNALTKGESMTKRQSAVMDQLGLDSVALAKRMQVDAKGAIYEVIGALAELPKYQQNAAIGKLFGEESKGAITPLLTNLDLLRQSFALVSEPAQYAGSMLAEYEKQAGTTAAALKLTANFVRGLAIATGSILLPELNAVLAAIQPLVTAATDWAAAHPELVRQIVRVVAGLVAFKAASIALRFTLFSLGGPVLSLVRGLFGLGTGLVGLLNPMKWVRGGLMALRMAVISTGIGALVAGLAMAGVWIYNNWSGLKTFFTGFGSAFMAALGPARPLAEGVVQAVKSIWNWLSKLLGPLDASAAQWTAWGQSAGAAVGNAVAAVGGFVGDVIDWFANLPHVVWSDLVPEFSWSNVVTSFSWSSVLATLVWALWATPLKWASFVPKLPWRVFITPIEWATRAGKLVWKSLIPVLKWTTSLIGKIPWTRMLGKFSLSKLLIPLKWSTRLIPGIGWALLAGELLWSYLIKPLGWDKYVTLEGLKAAWAKVAGFITGVAGKIWNGISKIDWLGFINLEGIKKAWNAVSDWLGSAAATIWDAIPEMPSLFGGDEIEDPKTLLAAKKAADELAKQFPALEAASKAVLSAAQAALRGVNALFTNATLQDAGARLIQSLATGMLSKEAAVIAAARKIGRAIDTALPKNAKVAVTLAGGAQTPVQKRAKGGAYGPGWLLTGEEGPELRYESQGGFIAHNQALRSMLSMAGKARGMMAGAGRVLGQAMPRIDTRAPMQSAPVARGAAPVTHLNLGGITINATAGQDPEAIARAVRRELESISRSRTANLHDGGAF